MQSMTEFRRRIYQIVEKSEERSGFSYGYDIFMSVCICLSLLPLFFRQQYPDFTISISSPSSSLSSITSPIG